MKYENVEVFNAERSYVIEGVEGAAFNRFSEEAVKGIDSGPDRNGHRAQSYGNEIEIRFVTDGSQSDIYLGAWGAEGFISIYAGDYHQGIRRLPEGEIIKIELERSARLQALPPIEGERFPRNMWRIVFLKRYVPVFAGVDGRGGFIRPPERSEAPRKTILAYGSSITFGAGTGPESDVTHMQLAARKAGAQVLNKSMPGSCFCELSMGDYLSGIEADLYYYELGGNMRLRHTPEEFEKRAFHLVRETSRKNPGKPIVLPGVCELLKSLPGEDSVKANSAMMEFDKTLKKLAAESENIHFIESADICSSRILLSADGLHPSIYGNIEMGMAIYEKIKEII